MLFGFFGQGPYPSLHRPRDLYSGGLDLIRASQELDARFREEDSRRQEAEFRLQEAIFRREVARSHWEAGGSLRGRWHRRMHRKDV